MASSAECTTKLVADFLWRTEGSHEASLSSARSRNYEVMREPLFAVYRRSLFEEINSGLRFSPLVFRRSRKSLMS